MWQDWYFAASGIFYAAVLIPSCLDPKTEVPRRSSSLTFACIVTGSIVYTTLGMVWAATFNLIGALPWACLWARRPIREERLPSMNFTEEEIRIVHQYREFVSSRQTSQRGGIVGGCGGCPSAGECGPELLP